MTSLSQANQLTDRAVAAFRTLLPPGGVLADSWRSSPYLSPCLEIVEMLPSYDEVLSYPCLRPPYLLMLRGGDGVGAAEYCDRVRINDGSPDEWVLNFDRFHSLAAAGVGVKFNRMEVWCEPVGVVARALSHLLSRPVKAWGFVSNDSANVVRPHSDPAHVLAFQIEGRKEWGFSSPPPEGHWVASKMQPQIVSRLELRAGEVLYIPYGMGHSAESVTERSFHIAFAVESSTVGEFSHRVIQRLARSIDGTDSTEITDANLGHLCSTLGARLKDAGERLSALDQLEAAAVLSGQFPASLEF